MSTATRVGAVQFRGRRRAAGLAVAVLALAAAGCTSASGAAPGPSASAGTAVVTARPSSLGTILVDAAGKTIYEFANDTTGVSTCSGACTADWPPVPSPKSLPSSLPGVKGALGTTTTGTAQLTVAGHPLYTFAGDSQPGQTNGQRLTLNGGLWTAVAADGSPVTKANRNGSSASGY